MKLQQYYLPTLTSRDLPEELRQKEESLKRKRKANRCFDTNSCDCPRCQK